MLRATSNVSFSFAVASGPTVTAKNRGVPVEIVEWPGGTPRQIDLDVPPQVFAAVRKGRMTVPLGEQPKLAEVAGLPWCSVATLRSNGEKLHRIVGPAIRQKDHWSLPVLLYFLDPAVSLEQCQKEASKLRRSWGLEPASA